MTIVDTEVVDAINPRLTVGELINFLKVLPKDMPVSVREEVKGPCLSYSIWSEICKDEIHEVMVVAGGELFIGKR